MKYEIDYSDKTPHLNLIAETDAERYQLQAMARDLEREFFAEYFASNYDETGQPCIAIHLPRKPR